MRKWLRIATIPLLSVIILIVFYFYSAESGVKGPTQPVLFSHKVHAGDNMIPCQYCHSYVDISPVPGIPSVQKCMGCHTHIAGRDVEYGFDGKSINMQKEIQKVKDYWNNKEPIPWVKVNMLPDFVHFNHKRHIRRGIDCTACHGEIASMDMVHQVNNFSMGYCLTCHQMNAKDEQELTHLRDCLTCHY